MGGGSKTSGSGDRHHLSASKFVADQQGKLFTGLTIDGSLQFDDFEIKVMAYLKSCGPNFTRILNGEFIVKAPGRKRPPLFKKFAIEGLADEEERRRKSILCEFRHALWDEYDNYIMERAQLFYMLQGAVAVDSEAYALVRHEYAITDEDDKCSPSRLWAALKQKYAGKTMDRRMELETEWNNLEIAEGETLTLYGQRIQRLRNSLEASGAEVSDEQARTKFYVACGGYSTTLAETLIAADHNDKDKPSLTLEDAIKRAETFSKKVEVIRAGGKSLKTAGGHQDIKALAAHNRPFNKSKSDGNWTKRQLRNRARNLKRAANQMNHADDDETPRMKPKAPKIPGGILKKQVRVEEEEYDDDDDDGGEDDLSPPPNKKFKFTVRTQKTGGKQDSATSSYSKSFRTR